MVSPHILLLLFLDLISILFPLIFEIDGDLQAGAFSPYVIINIIVSWYIRKVGYFASFIISLLKQLWFCT